MSTRREAALVALRDLVKTALPNAIVRRNEVREVDVTGTGFINVIDGDPREPEIMIGYQGFSWEHEAELHIYVQDTNDDRRHRTLDGMVSTLTSAILADRTLGGKVEDVLPLPPTPDTEAVQGAEPITVYVMPIRLYYDTTSPTG